VPGFDGVFTVDIDSGLGPCAPTTWIPAIWIMRGIQGNAGVGQSLRDLYVKGTNAPQYVLVAAEACVQCGEFVVLVSGTRSGQYWNTATAAAHALQKSKPTPPGLGGPDHPLGPWQFLGLEPQPVSDACLKALPLDPCWGSGGADVNWNQPVASSASVPTPAPAPGAPTPLPTLDPAAPPATPSDPAAELAALVAGDPNVIPSPFCDTWINHAAGFVLTCDPATPTQATADVHYRIFTWCSDPSTGTTNPPPCDPPGDWGGRTTWIITGTADPNVVFAHDTSTYEIIRLSMQPGQLLAANGKSDYLPYCSTSTDPAVASLYCGA
jgi:hypothetical protein